MYSYRGKPLNIPSSFWFEFLNKNNKLHGKWTNTLSKIFNAEEEYKYCVLAFEGHHLYECKNGKITFTATAQCLNTICTKFKFSFKGIPKVQP